MEQEVKDEFYETARRLTDEALAVIDSDERAATEGLAYARAKIEMATLIFYMLETEVG